MALSLGNHFQPLAAGWSAFLYPHRRGGCRGRALVELKICLEHSPRCGLPSAEGLEGCPNGASAPLGRATGLSADFQSSGSEECGHLPSRPAVCMAGGGRTISPGE